MMFFSRKISLYSVILFQFIALQARDHVISFIMPCYNVEDTVSLALQSIVDQSIAYPYEIICCDDGSTDNTRAVLQHWEKKYPHIHLVVHEKNRGAGAAANSCVRASRGDLLFRLDADNQLAEPQFNTMNRLVALLDQQSWEQHGCDAVMVEDMILFEGSKEIKTILRYQAPDNICDLQHCITCAHNPAMSGNFLYTRAAFDRVGGYPEDHGSDTFRFGFKLYATGHTIALLPSSFYWHFYNPNGYWWREQKTGNNDKKALETVLEYKHLFSRSSQRLLEAAGRGETTLFILINNRALTLKTK